MRFLYSYLALPFYYAGLLSASLFYEKANLWIQGRKGQWQHMKSNASSDLPLAWFHCASLGEFEQGRPLIEAFRKQFPGYRILLTFFSPSGYQVRKDYPGADHVYYLPLDTPGRVKQFLDTWNPSVAIFVKYEFWFNYMHQLHLQKIPVLVVSAIFRPRQHFFRFYGGWFRKELKKVSWFFVQNEASLELLHRHGIPNASVGGDTRFDRVSQIRESPRAFPLIEQFTRGHHVMVAGSTWPKDEELLLSLIRDKQVEMKFIIAPHEIHPDHILEMKNSMECPTALFSEVQQGIPEDTRVLIIDSIGMLSHLYQYGTLAYIGGGFGKGIHNILEAATFGLPVFFGPNYARFAEARELAGAGGAFPVNNAGELQQKVKMLLNNDELLESASATCRAYVEQKKGSTLLIMNYLEGILGNLR